MNELYINVCILTLSVWEPSLDVRIRRMILTFEDDPRTERIITIIMVRNIGIEIKQKELTKTFIMISK